MKQKIIVPENGILLAGFGKDACDALKGLELPETEGVTTELLHPDDESVRMVMVAAAGCPVPAQVSELLTALRGRGVLCLGLVTDLSLIDAVCADSIMLTGRGQMEKAIGDILQVPYNETAAIGLDFGDLELTLRDTGRFIVAGACAKGEHRADEVMQEIEALAPAEVLANARNVCLVIAWNRNTGTPPLAHEIRKTQEYLLATADHLNIRFGVLYDNDIDADSLRVTFIIAGCGV